jgi:hypothetical protein
VPASAADVTANFTLDGVTFSDGGTATGGFTLDLTTGTLSNVNVTTSVDGTIVVGDTFTGGNFISDSPPEFGFLDNYGLGEDEFIFELSATLTPSNLASTTSFSIASGQESGDFILCLGPDDFCGSRTITAGSLDVSSTPLPATLPLFGGGVSFFGWFGKKRRRKA